MSIPQDVISSIQTMNAAGNRLELPAQKLDNYPQVKKTLIKAGGVYKKNGFDFKDCAATVQRRLCNGQVIDDKKQYQFFETPPEVLYLMFSAAALSPQSAVLEPSAGRGAIALCARERGAAVTTVELNPDCCAVLREQFGFEVIEADFLIHDFQGQRFDCVLMNPPFTQNQYIHHVCRAWALVKPGGELLAIVPPAWTYRQDTLSEAFKEWIESAGGTTTPLPEGAFKASGTSVSTLLLHLQKEG